VKNATLGANGTGVTAPAKAKSSKRKVPLLEAALEPMNAMAIVSIKPLSKTLSPAWLNDAGVVSVPIGTPLIPRFQFAGPLDEAICSDEATQR
jgi:hypothetical protein